MKTNLIFQLKKTDIFQTKHTVKVADHEVSPLSEEAVQVYKPESLNCKSKRMKLKLEIQDVN